MKIRSILLTFLGVATMLSANAQQTLGGHFYGEDAFRYSNFGTNGTARMQGLGGSYSALGGDATSGFTNPAGLGFYNHSEISISPFYNSQTANTTYQGTTNSLMNNNVSIGQASLVMHIEGRGGAVKSSAFSISYSKQAYLNTQFNYIGTKARSSMQDYFAQLATQRGVNGQTLDNEYDATTAQSQTLTSMAYEAFLINPTTSGGTAYQRFEPNLPSQQSGSFSSSGASSQTNLSYGMNFDDKTYIGFGLGIAKIAYDYDSNHREIFTNGTAFNSFTFADNLSTVGTGINLSIGGIFKASPNLQFGVNLISPTWYSMSETYNSSISIDYKPNTISAPSNIVSTYPQDFDYNITTPLRLSGGAAFFFANKHGVLSADAEYVGYSLMKVSDPNEADNSYVGWSSDQKKGIQNTYNDVVNFKIGGEFRFDAIRLRAGFNYRPDPYKKNIDGIDHTQTAFSAGVGYRNSKFFVDLAGVYTQNNMGYTPYTLTNAADYASAQVKTNSTSLVLSVGTFF